MDHSLTARNISDNVKTFKLFFEGFYPSVCIFANKYVKDLALAEDIALEAFTEFWKSMEKFEDLKAIRGFIYTVTRNKCLNSIKQAAHLDHNLKDDRFSEDYFHESIIEEETYRLVHLAVGRLAPQSQRIIRLCLEGEKNQSIADRLNVSINTVKTLKKNSYEELRNHLKNHFFLLAFLNQFLF